MSTKKFILLAIIILLAVGAGLFYMRPANGPGDVVETDTQRVASLDFINRQVWLYAAEHGGYPVVSGPTPEARWASLLSILHAGEDKFGYPYLLEDLSPQDPKNTTRGFSYDYQSDQGGSSYVIKAMLESRMSAETKFPRQRDYLIKNFGQQCEESGYCIYFQTPKKIPKYQ